MDLFKYPPKEDLQIRWNRVQTLMKETGAEACLIAHPVNLYYLSGKIVNGYIYLPVEGEPVEFIQRPAGQEGERIVSIRKPEEIPVLLLQRGCKLPSSICLEADQITYNEYLRLEKIFQPSPSGNATPILRKSRMIKTPWEIEQMRISAKYHAEVYDWIPSLFRQGMRDNEFQYEIEHVMRKGGSLGVARTFGNSMEIFMGSLLAGNNAATPSPYDFALGGGGLSPCLPIGASGEIIREGQSVMIDMAGNYTPYMTDMTRVYAFGTLSDRAYRAHELSIRMHDRLMETSKSGTSCAAIYRWCMEMVKEAVFAAHFMGAVQQAKFTGHGVGLEINELPVLTERSQDVLQTGMTIAFEPKFVLPDIGAVGIENTYLVQESGLEKITVYEEGIIDLIRD